MTRLKQNRTCWLQTGETIFKRGDGGVDNQDERKSKWWRSTVLTGADICPMKMYEPHRKYSNEGSASPITRLKTGRPISQYWRWIKKFHIVGFHACSTQVDVSWDQRENIGHSTLWKSVRAAWATMRVAWPGRRSVVTEIWEISANQ